MIEDARGGETPAKTVLIIPDGKEISAVTDKDSDFHLWFQNIQAVNDAIEKHKADDPNDPWAGFQWYLTGDNAYQWEKAWRQQWDQKKGTKR